MASALPYQTPVDHAPRERTDIGVTGDEPNAVLQVLSSETARKILGVLGDEPGTTSDIAASVDTSLQNAQYHLNHLLEAELVEPVGTWYSAKGKEMTVYGLTTEQLVVQFGDATASSSQQYGR
jgi:DNA-binding transcriptional ArsR family regulator